MTLYPFMRGPLLSPDDSGGKGGDANAGGDKGGKSDGGSKGSAGDDKQFSQADVDRIAAKVRGEVESKYGDYPLLQKTVKELSEAADKQKQSKLAEEGKYQEALDTMTKRHSGELDKLIGDRDGWRQKFEGLAIDNTILAEAQKQDAINPEDVLALVKAQVKLGADGVASFADGKSIADGLKAFLASRPHLIKSKSRAGSGQNHSTSGTGADHAGLTNKPLSEMTREEVRQLGGKGLIQRVQQANATPWVQKS